MNPSAIVSLSNLHFSYDPDLAYVICDLSLEIPTGSIAAILGPNGAGKSTLLHILLGMLTPQGGQVILDGNNISSYSRREMSRLVGIVPQIEHIPFEFSVMEYVLLGRAPYLGVLQMPSDEDYQKVTDILQMLNLTPLAHRIVLDLSGGERQMVLLARALAQQPRILLLDEPTSHLDLSNKGHILQILRNLAEQGVTVIFTTRKCLYPKNCLPHMALACAWLKSRGSLSYSLMRRCHDSKTCDILHQRRARFWEDHFLQKNFQPPSLQWLGCGWHTLSALHREQ
jgi:iron complex transport system ATP-binding protein